MELFADLAERELRGKQREQSKLRARQPEVLRDLVLCCDQLPADLISASRELLEVGKLARPSSPGRRVVPSPLQDRDEGPLGGRDRERDERVALLTGLDRVREVTIGLTQVAGQHQGHAEEQGRARLPGAVRLQG